MGTRTIDTETRYSTRTGERVVIVEWIWGCSRVVVRQDTKHRPDWGEIAVIEGRRVSLEFEDHDWIVVSTQERPVYTE